MPSKILKGSQLKKEGAAPMRAHRPRTEVMPEGGGVLDRRVIAAGETAERIIRDAEAEAERIRKAAETLRAGVESVREQARREGFAKGEAAGKALVTEQLLRLDRMREEFFSKAEPEIIRLVLAIAEKLIGQIAAERPDTVKGVVRQALERSIGDRITVKLNPEDYRTVMSEGYEFRDVLDRTKRLLFKEDETIHKGGCVVETEVGTIDAQIETQLEAIRKALEM